MNKFYRNYSEQWLTQSARYGQHVSALTREKLHAKSEIAAELAYRDDRIAALELQLAELHSVEANAQDAFRHAAEYQARYVHLNQALRTFASEVSEVISNSHGVAGYHLNGDIATWEDLELSVPELDVEDDQ